MASWKSKLLSQAGRTTLVASVLQSVPLYTMSTFHIPVSICDDIDWTMRHFWWVGNLKKTRFLASTSWDQICKPKRFGGLGIRKAKEVNPALLSKLAWKIASGDSALWCIVIRAKYDVTVEDRFPRGKANCSMVWRGMVAATDLAHKGAQMIIGSGTKIDI